MMDETKTDHTIDPKILVVARDVYESLDLFHRTVIDLMEAAGRCRIVEGDANREEPGTTKSSGNESVPVMTNEARPTKRESPLIVKRLRSLEEEGAEIREYLNLLPAAPGDEPDRSTMYVIADISEYEEPRSDIETHQGYALHMTTDPQLAHELLLTENARAPGRIGMYVYRHFNFAELRSFCDPEVFATIDLYRSQDVSPIRIEALPQTPPPTGNPTSEEATAQ